MIDFPSNECVAYSYQNGVNSAPVCINDCRVVHTDQFVILADRTPVFCSGRFVPENLELNSPNHQGRGQTVLALDRHAAWVTSATVGVNGDNIWLIQGVRQYTGTERTTDPNDSFLPPSFSDGCDK